MRMAGSAMASMFGDNKSPRYDELSNIGIEGRSQQRNTATAADAQAKMSDVQADATLQIAEHQASAIKAQGQAAGQSAMAGGIGSMISGIAGGFGSMGTSGGAAPATSVATSGMNYSSAFSNPNFMSSIFGGK